MRAALWDATGDDSIEARAHGNRVGDAAAAMNGRSLTWRELTAAEVDRR